MIQLKGSFVEKEFYVQEIAFITVLTPDHYPYLAYQLITIPNVENFLKHS